MDTVYTAIEGELQTADPKKIMSHPKWIALIGCAKRNFPEHLSVYQPSPLEQTRVQRMVRNTLATRTISNKLDLLDIIKKDNEDSFSTVGELAVSRLRYELLAASAVKVHDHYMKALNNDWRTWYEWEQSKASWYQGSADFERSAEKKHTGFSGGISKAGASAGASFSGQASAGLTLDKERGGQFGWKQKLKGNVQAQAQASGHASAEARMSDLMASADVGLESEAALHADIDYELAYTCKVKGEYLRRLLGPQVDLINARASGSADVHARASGSASASAGLGRLQNSMGTSGDLEKGASSFEKETRTANIRGVKVDLEGEVSLAVVMKGNASVAIGQAAEVEVSGDLFAGASASAGLECFINGTGVGLDIGGKLFAGFDIGTEQKISLKHPRRGVNIFSLKAREAATFGVGMSGKLAARATVDEVSFDTQVGATMGFGASFNASGIVSPRGLMLVGHDAIAIPTIYRMASLMKQYDPGSVHTKRLTTFSEYLNRKSSRAELTQVYLDCRGRMVSLVASLDREADAVQKKSARIPGFNGYGDVMGIEEINAVDGFVGNSQSKYFQYAADEIKLTDGTVLESVTRQDGRKDSVVGDDKNALMQAASDYAGKKQILRSGECIAFEVIKKDIKSGMVSV